jgi:hypothetical protein
LESKPASDHLVYYTTKGPKIGATREVSPGYKENEKQTSYWSPWPQVVLGQRTEQSQPMFPPFPLDIIISRDGYIDAPLTHFRPREFYQYQNQ